MREYWSCTKFADTVRGTAKPPAATASEWNKWNKEAKEKHPLRYWLAEEALNGIQTAIRYVPDKLHGVKYYINNRFVTRTHSLTASKDHIRPGTWRDLGDRILPCIFDELVNFVEVELAWKHVAWDQEARKKYNVPFWGIGWFRSRTWRCPQAGLDHLDWEMTLVFDESWGVEPSDPNYGKPTEQSASAKEIKELYFWYKDVYLNRPDVFDVTGWSDFCDRARKDGGLFGSLDNQTDQERDESSRILNSVSNLEEYRYDEETEMLSRLIKIRNRLWT